MKYNTEKLKKALVTMMAKQTDFDDGDLKFNLVQDAIDAYGLDSLIFDAEKCNTNIASDCNALFAIVFDSNGLWDLFAGTYGFGMLNALEAFAKENHLAMEAYHSWNLCFYPEVR